MTSDNTKKEARLTIATALKNYTLEREMEHEEEKERRRFLQLQKNTGGGHEVEKPRQRPPPLEGFTNPKYHLLPLNNSGFQSSLGFPVESRESSALLSGPRNPPQTKVQNLSSFTVAEAISQPFSISFEDPNPTSKLHAAAADDAAAAAAGAGAAEADAVAAGTDGAADTAGTVRTGGPNSANSTSTNSRNKRTSATFVNNAGLDVLAKQAKVIGILIKHIFLHIYKYNLKFK